MTPEEGEPAMFVLEACMTISAEYSHLAGASAAFWERPCSIFKDLWHLALFAKEIENFEDRVIPIPNEYTRSTVVDICEFYGFQSTEYSNV